MVEKNLPIARHEPTDVGGSFIWRGAMLVVGTVIALMLIVPRLYPHAVADRPLTLPLSPYPDPQLQVSSSEDMAKFYRGELQWLGSAGWIDKAHGITHIPIADAMRAVVREGIPGWPAPGESQP